MKIFQVPDGAETSLLIENGLTLIMAVSEPAKPGA